MLPRLLALTLALTCLAAPTSGCAALVDAAFREGNDHGDHATYENKDYHEHFFDSLMEEDDDDDGCHRTTVVIEHG